MKIYYDDRYHVLIECLKNYRNQASLSQEELAAALHRPQSYISKYEQCQKRLDIMEIREICICLGKDLETLVREFEIELKNKNLK